MKTLLITDLHFTDSPPGLLEHQQRCLKRIFYEEEPDEVIIMGDLMMRRKPTPSVLLALHDTLKYMHDGGADLYILRGNHDSETKADDGVTSLSLFKDFCKIVTHTWIDNKRRRVFIPHYENEEIIGRALDESPKDYTVFGHFGYNGCLNSAGDADFTIRVSRFRNTSYLGHVHGHTRREKITILGTPYSTNFGEAEKENFYAILDGDSVEFKKVTHGPRHIVLNASEIEDNLHMLGDSNYFTMLRVMLDNNNQDFPYDDIKNIVSHIDVKFKAAFDEDQLSSYSPSRQLFSINDAIISDYVDCAETTLTKESIMKGYSLLKEE